MDSNEFLKKRINDLENELKKLNHQREMISNSLNAYRQVYELELKREGKATQKKYEEMKIGHAVYEVIKEAQKTMTTKEVFQKLKEGGIQIGGKENVQLAYVYTCLKRLKKKGKVRKIAPGKWKYKKNEK